MSQTEAVSMDSSQLAAVPLDPSETAVSFPPHRRRPLLSRTYRTLVRIISHCSTTAPAPQLQTQGDNDHSISRSMGEENGSTTKGMLCSTDLLHSLPHSKQSEDKLAEEIFTVENKENDVQQEHPDKNTAGRQLNHINSVPDSTEEVAPASTNDAGDVLMVENQTNHCGIKIAKYQENGSNVTDIKMDDYGVLEQLEVDKELSINDFSEILDSCFGEDNFVQSSDVVKGNQESGIVLEDNLYKGSEHELQLKEMELEKLIYSGGVESTSCLNADEEIEEGQISGEAGFADASFDALSADVISLEERTTGVVHATQADQNKEKFISKNNNSGYVVLVKSSLIETRTSNNNFKMVESRAAAGQIQDCSVQNAIFGCNKDTQKSGSIGHCAESNTSVDKIIQVSAPDSDISSSRKDKETKNKKRKRGPGTKERRDKKKKKERIKRAEKNRMLGVKRLKLPPVLKQKKIVYCRHFLQGRCHEGEKCNFSHDTVPLTKSKPCGHFARQECMKGDDCPYDHDLSKYPCKNYASNGFCSRGSGCLFSHEMPANSGSMTPHVPKPDSTSAQHVEEGSFTASKNAKPDVKLQSPLNILNSSKPLNKFGCSNQKVDAKFGSAGSSPHSSTGPVPKTTGKAPKGVTFLLNCRMSSGDSSRNKDDGSSLKTGDGVHVGCKSVEEPGSINKLNEMSKRVPPSKPRGINFLSFAQPISDDPSSKMFSNLLSDVDNGRGKSVLDDAGEGKLIGSLLQSVATLQGNWPVNKSAVSLQQDVKKNDDRSSMAILRSMSFSPFDKTCLDTSIFKKQDNLYSAEGDTALSAVKERGMGSNLNDSIKLPSLSFSFPGNQLLDVEISKSSRSSQRSCLPNTPSSVQKAVQSALAYATKFGPSIKVRSSLHHGES